eukprot:CAMPEP_0197868208 /NCGR_PEP_ID=MMETSP1438-20131217/45163_1 /TAXON_ID=1461541 /ORGANISM="Pterosperma sp., Strain CCMP1384" /LENGTH=118 /DNA_ID=CAMNT_0043486899 /DNA_START=104 /DNA_END=460 /DNA_ORIENTATION=+
MSSFSDTQSSFASSTGRRNHAQSRITDNIIFEGNYANIKEKKNALTKSWDFQEMASEDFKKSRRAANEHPHVTKTRHMLGVPSRVADAVIADRVLPNMTKPVFVPKKGALKMWHGADI